MPKKKQDDFYDLEALLSENKINKKELLSTIIDALQKFCQDNILSLHPLCDETSKPEPIQERILYFSMISSILDGVEKLNNADVVLTPKKSKKKSTKKKTK